MSPLTLPEPTNWPAGRRQLTRLTWFTGGVVVIGALFCIHRILLHDYPGAFIGTGFVVPFVMIVIARPILLRGRNRLRACRDSSGTTFHPDRALVALMIAMLFLMLAWALVVGYFALTNQLDLTGFRHGKAGLLGLVGFMVLTLVGGLFTAWQRGGIGHVKLTPSGIDIADVKNTQTVEWKDVIAVDDHSETNKKTRKAIVLRLSDDTEKTINAADFYVPKGTGLYWMVRHYWRHPDDRQELTDERALARLNDGNFDVT